MSFYIKQLISYLFLILAVYLILRQSKNILFNYVVNFDSLQFDRSNLFIRISFKQFYTRETVNCNDTFLSEPAIMRWKIHRKQNNINLSIITKMYVFVCLNFKHNYKSSITYPSQILTCQIPSKLRSIITFVLTSGRKYVSTNFLTSAQFSSFPQAYIFDVSSSNLKFLISSFLQRQI